MICVFSSSTIKKKINIQLFYFIKKNEKHINDKEKTRVYFKFFFIIQKQNESTILKRENAKILFHQKQQHEFRDEKY